MDCCSDALFDEDNGDSNVVVAGCGGGGDFCRIFFGVGTDQICFCCCHVSNARLLGMDSCNGCRSPSLFL